MYTLSVGTTLGNEGQRAGLMVRCLFCQKDIENPRKFRDEIVQKFCSDKCRYGYHNRLKKEERVFVKETISLLRKTLRNRGDSL